MKPRLMASVVAVGLLLAACTGSSTGGSEVPVETSSLPVATSESASGPSSAPTPSPTPTPTPTPTGPVQLTVEEAGAIYLQQACEVTKVEKKYEKVRDRNDPYRGSDEVPSEKTKQAAQKAADANEEMALALADSDVLWPEGIRKDIRTVAAWEYKIASHYLEIVDAESWADVGAYPRLKNPDSPAKIRLALELPPPGQCD